MIEPALRAVLVANTAVAGIAADRVYFLNKPQNVRRPCVVINRTGSGFFPTFKGRTRVIRGTLQFDCLAENYPAAKQLGRAVREALDNYSGTSAGVPIRWVEIEDESDVPTLPIEGRATPLFGVSIDVRVMYDE